MEIIIYASFVIITLMCLWALISIPKNYLFKSILIPLMIGVAVSTWYTYNAILGYGTEYKPSDKVVYLYHLSDKIEKKIYLLIVKAGEKEPRLHIYPYSKKLEEALEEAKKKGAQGIMVVGELKKEKRKTSNRRIANQEEYRFYEMPPNVWMPKK